MKKLLFVLAFAFIGQQAFSQMYIVTVYSTYGQPNHPSGCSISMYDAVMTTVDPLGNLTYDCMPNVGNIYSGDGSNLVLLNQKFNTLASQGYKLISTDANNAITHNNNNIMGAWYFAIP
jgi:hypothetical protein